MSPRSTSIHIGVGDVDPRSYPRRPERLLAAEADARAMLALAASAGLVATLLVGADATRDAVIRAFRDAASELAPGDLLVVSFSGHGATFADDLPADSPRRARGAINVRPGDEAVDQSWCLHDGVLIDDDLHVLLAGFHAGVRVYVLSDSCFSGTILRHDDALARADLWPDGPPDVLRGDDAPAASGDADVQAAVLLSAAATDTDLSFTNEIAGFFTRAVVDAWDGGHFTGDHEAFHAAIQARCRASRVPPLVRYGRLDLAFEASRPFGG